MSKRLHNEVVVSGNIIFSETGLRPENYFIETQSILSGLDTEYVSPEDILLLATHLEGLRQKASHEKVFAVDDLNTEEVVSGNIKFHLVGLRSENYFIESPSLLMGLDTQYITPLDLRVLATHLQELRKKTPLLNNIDRLAKV